MQSQFSGSHRLCDLIRFPPEENISKYQIASIKMFQIMYKIQSSKLQSTSIAFNVSLGVVEGVAGSVQ